MLPVSSFVFILGLLELYSANNGSPAENGPADSSKIKPKQQFSRPLEKESGFKDTKTLKQDLSGNILTVHLNLSPSATPLMLHILM